MYLEAVEGIVLAVLGIVFIASSTAPVGSVPATIFKLPWMPSFHLHLPSALYPAVQQILPMQRLFGMRFVFSSSPHPLGQLLRPKGQLLNVFD
jgi:hypothetical protein